METGAESDIYRAIIAITPPWYLSTLAKIIYMVFVIAAIFFIAAYFMPKQRQKQSTMLKKMEQAHKEEMYEEKLRFFTNITHEFCTPLTLIYGGCERILAGIDENSHLDKYAKLIRSNAERLNSLIQDLIEFRRFESGNINVDIRKYDISEIAGDIYNSFSVIAEQNHIEFKKEIEPDIEFNTNYKSFMRITSNLISNAFKYTPSGGKIIMGVKVKDNNLVIEVYNTGKGISDEDKKKIFNRYSILDNVEENATKGLSSRNGLGMAIVNTIVGVLNGKIDIESKEGEYAKFIVTIPEHPINVVEENLKNNPLSSTPSFPAMIPTHTANEDYSDSDKNKYNILVIDDNQDILMLLKDSLLEYNVITAPNAEKGLEELKNNNITLIITDVMMPGMDGKSLTKQIKGNRHTMHIPMIILSAKNSEEEKTAGLMAGADAYVGKPFHIAYLRALVARLIENKTKLQEYYNSSASAFEYSEGQLVDKESKDFIDMVNEFIDTNIDNADLTTEQIADHMQMSVRNLYRKFKELDLKSPNDFIKQYRLTFAAKLLVTTSLTVQEILYRVGFNNRSHFYREFSKQYGMTPKDYRNENKKINTN